MSSEVHKYIESAIEKRQNLFNADVINFPNDKKINTTQITKEKKYNYWKISDESNYDQFKAVTGICFMFAALIIMGLYSNLI